MTVPPGDTTTDLHAAIAELRAERDAALSEKATLVEALAQRNSEFGERIEHQAATIDVLKAMSASPGDPQPIFDLITKRALALCNGLVTGLFLLEGEFIQIRSAAGLDEEGFREYRALFPMRPNISSTAARAILERRIIHVRDIEHDADMSPTIRRQRWKAALTVPIMRNGLALGSISLGAAETGGFTDGQVELVKIFAEQAVIAIASAETYRALQTRTADLQETLEYQTATSDVLKAISRSTFALQPVLDTLVETAARLCDADQALIYRREGDLVRLVANYGFPPEYEAVARGLGAIPLDNYPRNVGPRAVREGRVVHVHDVAVEPGYSEVAIRFGKQRTSLGVPLLRDGSAIGFFVLARQRVEPFTNRQIDLVSTFADQAAIAIENTRLITEQREALEQQTATAEVLQVINASPGNLAPVFDTMLEKALRLCGAAFGNLWTYDGEVGRLAAICGASPEYRAELMRAGPQKPEHGSSLMRLVEGEPLIHIADITAEGAHRSGAAVRRMLADRAGARTVLWVPMRKDGALLGFFTIYRTEVRPFTDKQIALLQNFAAQAVIAMENARLLGELRQRTSDLQETLEQQTATAEVLQVINSSPGDLRPVFYAILEKAHSLCRATKGAFVTFDGEHFQVAVTRGLSEPYVRILREAHQNRSPREELSPREQLLKGASFVHLVGPVPPLTGPIGRAGAELENIRTVLFVPLRRDGMLLGYVTAYREEEVPFSDKHTALLQSFAAQAVIAMENARLLTEQREALEQQIAVAEVLRVINASPGDLETVFITVLEKAIRLCGAAFGTLTTYDGKRFRTAAMHGLPPAYAEFREKHPPAGRPGSPGVQIVETRRPVHIIDQMREEGYRSGDPHYRAVVDLGGARTYLAVPLLKDDSTYGYISIYRREVRAFSEKQIALLESFAAQAAIAVENAKLLAEQREALEQQTATAEVLQVINASPGNLAPVFETILDKAHTLCGATLGSLFLFDGELFCAAAIHGYPEDLAQRLRQGVILTATTQLLDDGVPWVHNPDLTLIDGPTARAVSGRGGVRTNLMVPLRKDGKLLGAISCNRQEVRLFTDKEIALLQNFAAQAVIAMENARLIDEQREALEQQTATAEVLQVINASPGDLVPVFDAMVVRAATLCEADEAAVRTFDGSVLNLVAAHGPPGILEELKRLGPSHPDGLYEAIAQGASVTHLVDVWETEAFQTNARARERLELRGIRSWLAVALRKEGALLGVINVHRREVRPFTEKQIALLQNFAAQAVIAMENARLLTETREALEQQTATAEVLQVINSSPGDLAPVFDTILEKALKLCGAAFGGLSTFDGERRTIMARTPAYEAYMTAEGETSVIPPLMLRVIETKRPVQIADRRDGEGFRAGASVRTLLHVPLLKDEIVLGCITVYRQEVRLYSDKEIALLQNFAAQAVIAMENARLLNEQRDALEQQTATAEVLQVINSSPGDLQPVFEAILEKAHSICGAALGSLTTFDGEFFRAVAIHGFPEQHVNVVRRPFRPNSDHQNLIQGDRLIHLPDVRALEIASDDEVKQSTAERTDVRTLLAVPLRKDGTLLGFISACRLEVRPFSEREIALLENFAAQAVIAMENARLLDEIRQRQEELRITFENMGDGVAMFDETQRLVAWNGKFQEIFGLPAVLLEQHRTYEEHLQFLAARGDFGAGVDTAEQIHELVASTGQPYGYERTRPDGKVIEIRRNPVPDGGFVLIFSDITERKRSEAEIRAARDAAEGASRAIEAAYRDLKAAQANLIQAEKMASLGQLTAGIAHEIKNPLNFVNNFSRLSTELIDELRDVLAPEPLGKIARTEVDDITALLKGNLEKVVQHGQRADGIVRSMLDHSRGSSGERRMVDLNALIDDALNLAYHGARAQDQSFSITLERAFGAGIAPIEVNPQDITRVFLNIFSNGFYAAARRARNGGDAGFVPTLTVTSRDAGEMVEIRVRDNGTGIPADIKDKLFQPFFTTKPTGEGTGLGLSITYDIVTQQHGGDIAVDSKVGDYSEFTIQLPRKP